MKKETKNKLLTSRLMKVISIAIILSLCLTMLTACGEDEKPAALQAEDNSTMEELDMPDEPNADIDDGADIEVTTTSTPTPTPTATPTTTPTTAPTSTTAPTTTQAPTATTAPTAPPATTQAPPPPTQAPTTAPTNPPAPPTEAPPAPPTQAPTTAPTVAPTEAPTPVVTMEDLRAAAEAELGAFDSWITGQGYYIEYSETVIASDTRYAIVVWPYVGHACYELRMLKVTANSDGSISVGWYENPSYNSTGNPDENNWDAFTRSVGRTDVTFIPDDYEF
ncbi:MAG: hypothetical protein MJ154_00590 [Candidatus Saccharibacteria bacterium]|nr:hypothetical protein [Candidatus Saccharibacteria bacterium]